MSDDELKVVFREAVKKQVDDAQARVIDDIDEAVTGAMRVAIQELLGVRWDWGRWEFDPHRRVNGNDVQGSAIRDAVRQRAGAMTGPLIDKALEKPLEFGPKEIARLRTILKDEVMEVAEQLIRARARDLASELVGEIDL